jgi:hypothetical protein
MGAASFFQTYTRRHNYISDYFHTVYERYISTYQSFPINYYSMDTSSTIWEEDRLRGGTYEKNGIGELSGKKFKKIYELPIFQLTSIQASYDSNEMGGLTLSGSMQGNFSLPQVYGLKPNKEDVIDLNFGFKNTGNPSKTLYIITNYDLAHHGDEFNLYKCDIKVAPFTKDDIEKQLTEIWKFYEPSKSILPYTNTSILYKMIRRAEKNSDNLKNLYHGRTSLYLDKIYL